VGMLIGMCLGWLPGQTLQFEKKLSAEERNVPDSQARAFQLGLPSLGITIPVSAPSSDAPFTLPSPYVLPAFARENPSGYSFLCRTEIKWEQNLPLGVWFRSETTGEAISKGILPSTYVRLRRPF